MMLFSPWEYLMIDIANNHYSGLDKQPYEIRLKWVQDNLDSLEQEAEENNWKERPLFIKAVSALRLTQQGKPTGHLVGFDSVNSGMQLMSVVTGCKSGATATGLVDRSRRADAYTDCTAIMSRLLGKDCSEDRKKVKLAVMTSLYGSKAEPVKVFGEDTDELQAFYQAMYELAPGAIQLLDVLSNSWIPYTLAHGWTMPDGYNVVVKVMKECKERIEVEELANSTFTFQYYENEGKKKDVKNVANIVHSLDAYVLRCLVRRCNYDANLVTNAYNTIADELVMREIQQASGPMIEGTLSPHVQECLDRYQRTNMIDVCVLDGTITMSDIALLPTGCLKKLIRVLGEMLRQKPFEVITIHDDFKCHPNYMNQLRFHYNQILADLAESNVIEDIVAQITGTSPKFVKDPTLPQLIREANYALC